MTDPATFARDVLGHRFGDPKLVELALTHSSVGSDSYERLEFLGDRVLGLVIARWLFDRFPHEPQGKLSRRLNALVSRETCAEVGRRLGVPELIRLGRQAREDGAHLGDNVTGDVVEALIGALSVDGGLKAAERFIRTGWSDLIEGQGSAPQHPKSELQERAAARGADPPRYEVVSQSGSEHAPLFVVRVSVGGLGEAEAEGLSKQEAETAAAAALLGRLR